jgi:hypothetical protein
MHHITGTKSEKLLSGRVRAGDRDFSRAMQDSRPLVDSVDLLASPAALLCRAAFSTQSQRCGPPANQRNANRSGSGATSKKARHPVRMEQRTAIWSSALVTHAPMDVR